MPQKRNPVSIEHTRSLLSAVVGDTGTVLQMIHNTPFGDIVDTEDDMQPYLWRAIDRLIGIYKLFGSLVITMNVNKENLLKRAQNSFANVTELADTLVRSENISFRQSHSIVSRCVRTLMEDGEESLSNLTWEIANEKSLEVTGKPLHISQNDFYHALQPEYFINVRKILGGPSPETMRQSLKIAEKDAATMAEWVRDKIDTILEAEQKLEGILQGWDAD